MCLLGTGLAVKKLIVFVTLIVSILILERFDFFIFFNYWTLTDFFDFKGGSGWQLLLPWFQYFLIKFEKKVANENQN